MSCCTKHTDKVAWETNGKLNRLKYRKRVRIEKANLFIVGNTQALLSCVSLFSHSASLSMCVYVQVGQTQMMSVRAHAAECFEPSGKAGRVANPHGWPSRKAIHIYSWLHHILSYRCPILRPGTIITPKQGRNMESSENSEPYLLPAVSPIDTDDTITEGKKTLQSHHTLQSL